MYADPNAGMQLKDYLTLTLSSASFLLATLSLYLQRRDKRPKLIVRLKAGHRDVVLGGDRIKGYEHERQSGTVVLLLNRSEHDVAVQRIEFKPLRGSAKALPDSAAFVPKGKPKEAGPFLAESIEESDGAGVRKSPIFGRFVVYDAADRVVGRSKVHRWSDQRPYKRIHVGGVRRFRLEEE